MVAGSRSAGRTGVWVLTLVVVVALAVAKAISARPANPVVPPSKAPPGHARTMPQMLTAVDQSLTPDICIYLNSQRAMLMRSRLEDPNAQMSVSERLDWVVLYARELVNAGQTERAIEEFRNLVEQVKKHAPAAWKQVGSNVLTQEAIGYLRLGEEQNCCSTNNAQSCIVPIAGKGIHTKQYGSRNAIRCLEEALSLSPDNIQARWLLNVACMTVGDYPARVPAKWLIPASVFGGEGKMARFYNAAPELGIDFPGWAGGVATEDFDGDGLPDLLITSIRPGMQMRFYHSNGDGTFTDRTKDSGLIGETGGLNFILTDYNNDGRPDVIVLRGGWMGKSGHYPLSLLRNDGGGHFTDVTLESGIFTVGPTQTAVAFDYNGDGFLDLFVGYESTPGDPVPCKLFRNNGNGTFTDVTEACGLHITAIVKAVVSADFLHSGRPGLYLSCNDRPNILLRNDGPAGPDRSPMAPWKFTDIGHQAGVDKQHGTFSSFFVDYDNDGWPDLFVGGYSGIDTVGDVAKDYLGMPTGAEKAKLYRNNGNGTFTDVSKKAGLDRVIIAMGLNFGDLDNDGWVDFYASTGNPDLGMLVPNRMYRNRGGQAFEEVTSSGGFGHLQKGHAVSFTDLNNDGQQDVFTVMGGAFEGDTARDCLFVNPGSNNHWIALQLTGVKSNRIAMGAEICVTVTTPHGERQIYRTVGTGGSFGCNPLRQEIGLGDATAIKQIAIRWPGSGTQQTLSPIAMDGFYLIREGDSRVERYTPPKFRLPIGPITRQARR